MTTEPITLEHLTFDGAVAPSFRRLSCGLATLRVDSRFKRSVFAQDVKLVNQNYGLVNQYPSVVTLTHIKANKMPAVRRFQSRVIWSGAGDESRLARIEAALPPVLIINGSAMQAGDLSAIVSRWLGQDRRMVILCENEREVMAVERKFGMLIDALPLDPADGGCATGVVSFLLPLEIEALLQKPASYGHEMTGRLFMRNGKLIADRLALSWQLGKRPSADCKVMETEIPNKADLDRCLSDFESCLPDHVFVLTGIDDPDSLTGKVVARWKKKGVKIWFVSGYEKQAKSDVFIPEIRPEVRKRHKTRIGQTLDAILSLFRMPGTGGGS